MKWIIIALGVLLMSGCFYSNEVEYRQVMPVTTYNSPGVDVTTTAIDWH